MQNLSIYLDLLKESDKQADALFARIEREATERHTQQDTWSRVMCLNWQVGALQGTIRSLMQQLALEKHNSEKP